MINGKSTAASTARTVSAACSGERSPSSGWVPTSRRFHQVGAQFLDAACPGGGIGPHIVVYIRQRLRPFGWRRVQHVQGRWPEDGASAPSNARKGMPSAPPIVTERPRVPPSAFVAPIVTRVHPSPSISLWRQVPSCKISFTGVLDSLDLWEATPVADWAVNYGSATGVATYKGQFDDSVVAQRVTVKTRTTFRTAISAGVFSGRRKTFCSMAPAASTLSSWGTSGSRSA